MKIIHWPVTLPPSDWSKELLEMDKDERRQFLYGEFKPDFLVTDLKMAWTALQSKEPPDRFCMYESVYNDMCDELNVRINRHNRAVLTYKTLYNIPLHIIEGK